MGRARDRGSPRAGLRGWRCRDVRGGRARSGRLRTLVVVKVSGGGDMGLSGDRNIFEFALEAQFLQARELDVGIARHFCDGGIVIFWKEGGEGWERWLYMATKISTELLTRVHFHSWACWGE
jgi:hypothetical protein